MRMLCLYFDESMGEIETEIKKYSMVDDYLLDKGLDKIKEILGFEKFDDTKIFINTDDKLRIRLL